MIKLVLVLLLSYLTLAAYNVSLSRNLALICADTFATSAEINSWTCKYCPQYKLTNVSILTFRPRLSTTLSSTFSASPATLLRTMQSLWPSGAQSAFKTGLSTSMPHKYSLPYPGFVPRLLGMQRSPGLLQCLHGS